MEKCHGLMVDSFKVCLDKASNTVKENIENKMEKQYQEYGKKVNYLTVHQDLTKTLEKELNTFNSNGHVKL